MKIILCRQQRATKWQYLGRDGAGVVTSRRADAQQFTDAEAIDALRTWRDAWKSWEFEALDAIDAN